MKVTKKGATLELNDLETRTLVAILCNVMGNDAAYGMLMQLEEQGYNPDQTGLVGQAVIDAAQVTSGGLLDLDVGITIKEVE